jgi:hypothetical protein
VSRKKRMRAVKRLAAAVGIRDVHIAPGGKHYRLVGVLPNDQPLAYTLAGSPSDPRSDLNMLAQLRRMVREAR